MKVLVLSSKEIIINGKLLYKTQLLIKQDNEEDIFLEIYTNKLYLAGKTYNKVTLKRGSDLKSLKIDKLGE